MADDPASRDSPDARAARRATASRTRPPARPRDRPPSPGARGDPTAGELPVRLVVVAYVLALTCAVAPLAILGAGFAGAVVYRRGRRGAGAGVVAVAVLCAVLGFWLRR